MGNTKKNSTYVYYNLYIAGLRFHLRISSFSRFFFGSGEKNKYLPE